MHRDSHTISKTKPKIRIIHIFAPEIIKTDAENFRELVQKLTGKPSGGGGEKKCCKKKIQKAVTAESKSCGSSSSTGLSEDSRMMVTTKKTEVRNGAFWGLDQTKGDRSSVKEEIGSVSRSEERSGCGGYLGGFSDLEGFISEIGGFPMLPTLDGSTHMQMQGFELL